MNKDKSEISVMHLHLELTNEYISEYQKRMLRRYGESSTGNSICRDILIPSDMPLHNLHYTIQKLFGWQNSHLRCFNLPDDIYKRVTGKTVKGWADLVGILFQPPSEAEDDIFWDDNYEKGNFFTWLKKKYTGPYIYGGILEYPENARNDVQSLLDRFKLIDVKESFLDYMERSKKTDDAEIRILRKASLIDMTLEEMNSTIMLDSGTDNLLESLEISRVLADKDSKMDTGALFPVTKKLIYNYDFGDNWIVNITREDRYTGLVENGLISLDEITYSNDIVLKEHRPVCIHKDGINVLDDVGGLCGFADFLGTIYESDDKKESKSYLTWAKGLGWKDKKIGLKMIL